METDVAGVQIDAINAYSSLGRQIGLDSKEPAYAIHAIGFSTQIGETIVAPDYWSLQENKTGRSGAPLTGSALETASLLASVVKNAASIKMTDGNDTFHGRDAADVVFGGAGVDYLWGGGSDDVLSGGLGDDFLFGGADADHFVFNHGDGMDRVQDFEHGEDRIVFASGAGSFEDLVITNQGTSVLIRYDGGSILVATDDAAAFSASDFLF